MADPIVNVTTRTYNIQVTKKENKVVISSPGPQGAVGVGFPVGGTEGQFLTKINGTNYNTQWITLPSYQPLDSDLTAISALTQDGLLRKTSGNWVMDSTTYLVASDLSPYLTITSAAATYQPVGSYLTSYTETDPVFLASPAYSVTSQKITNWDTAYGWGNHSVAGYLTSSLAESTYLTQSNASSIYLTQSNATSTYQSKDQDLTDIAALTGNGIIRKTAGVWGIDSSVYLTSYTETDTLSSVTGRGASTSSAISIINTTQSTSYSTGALIIGGGVGIAKDLFVEGNLVLTGNIDINGTITGSLEQVNVTDLNVTDSLIYLGSENLTSDTLDIGIIGAYRPLGDTSGHKHTGFARDHNDSGIWKLFSGGDEVVGNDIDFGLNDVNVNFDQLKIRSLIVTDASTTRTNLGLGTMAVETASNYAPVSNPVFLTGISFEGTTVNDNETHLTVVDPTGDRTITLPDDTGTVALTKDTAKLASANTFTVGGHIFNNDNASTIPLIVRGFGTGGSSTQSVDLQQWNTYNGTTSTNVFRVSSSGAITTVSSMNSLTATIGQGINYGAMLSINTVSVANQGIQIRSVTGQTGDLLRFSDNSATILGGRNAVGQVYTGSTAPVYGSLPTGVGNVTTVDVPTATSVTINYGAAHNLTAGGVITVSGITGNFTGGTSPAGINGTYTILATTTTSVTYVYPTGGLTFPQSGLVPTTPANIKITVPAQMSITSRDSATKTLVLTGAAYTTTSPAIMEVYPGATTTSPTFTINTYGNIAVGAGLSVYGNSSGFGGTSPTGIYGNGGTNLNFISQPNKTDTLAMALQTSSANAVGDLLQLLQGGIFVPFGGINAAGQIYTGSATPVLTTIPYTAAPTGTGIAVTFTTTANHNLSVGDIVYLAGFTPASYNNTAVATTASGTNLVLRTQGTGAITVQGTISAAAQVSITPRSPGTKGLVIYGNTVTATTDFLSVLNNGASLTGIDSFGRIYVRSSNGASSSASLHAATGNTTVSGVNITGPGGQVADFFKIQNSSSVNIAGINASGSIYAGTTGTHNYSLTGTVQITNSTQSNSTTVTYTTSNNHGLQVGQFVNITGITATPTAGAHNLSGTVATVPSTTSFTLLASTTGTNSWVSGTGTFTTSAQTSITPLSTSTVGLSLRSALSKTATVTAASGNGTTVTYTCAQTATNAFVPGELVSVTGLTVTTGSSLNLAAQTVVTSSATQFTITNTTVGTAAATQAGTATMTNTSSLIVFYNSANTPVGRIDSDGTIRTSYVANNAAFANSAVTFGTTGVQVTSSSNTTNIPLRIQNANAGTVTGDLTQWLNNTGATVLAKVDASGNISTTGKVIGGGMDLVYSGTFTGAAVYGLPAATFTSSYKNYKIIYDLTSGTGTFTAQLYTTVGSTALATGYTGATINAYSAGTTTSTLASSTNWSLNQAAVSTRTAHLITLELFNPAVALGKYIKSQFYLSNPGVNGIAILEGQNPSTTVYDSIQLTPSSGTLTGTVYVYGYHN